MKYISLLHWRGTLFFSTKYKKKKEVIVWQTLLKDVGGMEIQKVTHALEARAAQFLEETLRMIRNALVKLGAKADLFLVATSRMILSVPV
jgi:hypothetical protein